MTGNMAPRADKFPVPVALIAIASWCLFFTTLTVCARVLTKALDWRTVQADDVSIFLAKVGLVAFVAVFFDSATAGQGTSVSQLSPESIQRVRRFSNILSVVYAPTMVAAKIAILVQMARFFSSIRRRAMYWMTWGLLAASTIGYIAILLLRILACTPGKCIAKNIDAIVAGIVGVTSNLAILLLMMHISTKVRLTHMKTSYLTLLLGLGVFACACCVLELVKGLLVVKSSDFSKATFSVNIWALADITSMLIIACSPTLPRLLNLIVRKSSRPKPSIDPKSISYPSSRSTTPGSKVDTPEHETPIMARASSMPTTPPPPPPALVRPSFRLAANPSPPRTGPTARPFSIFEPSEQRISHLSHSTWHSANSMPPSHGPSQRAPASPISPVSPTHTDYSVRELRAWEMSVMPVALGHITKTIQVRVSAHTNPGSPVTWGAPDPRW